MADLETRYLLPFIVMIIDSFLYTFFLSFLPVKLINSFLPIFTYLRTTTCDVIM